MKKTRTAPRPLSFSSFILHPSSLTKGGILSVALSLPFGAGGAFERWPLAITVSCGARTFLPPLCSGLRRAPRAATVRPTCGPLHYTRAGGIEGTPPAPHHKKEMPGAAHVRAGAPKGRTRNMPTHVVDWRQMPDASCRGGAVTVGNFDGVHRGHAALLDALRVQAGAVGGPAVVFTFDPHPMDILRPGQSPPPLTTTPERARLLHELGADQVVVVRSTPDLLALLAEEFFAQVVCDRLAARALVEGPNFRFGRGRGGDVETLARLCTARGMVFTVVPPVQRDGGEVSSSRIRAALQQGDVGDAATLLGRPYRLAGVVVTGRRRGQTIGFPTANLDAIPTVVPGDGVYAARAHVGGTAWPAAVNVGANPTFGEDAHKVEVHLIGFHGDLYGQTLAVDFLQRLRETRPFRGAAELIKQLKHDVEQARRIAAPA